MCDKKNPNLVALVAFKKSCLVAFKKAVAYLKYSSRAGGCKLKKTDVLFPYRQVILQERVAAN